VSITRYIQALAVSGDPIANKGVVGKSASSEAPAITLPTRLQSAVNAGSIISFADDVDAPQQTDILYSIQLAQRAASAIHDRFVETRAWYGKYNEVLEALGWVSEQYAFTSHQQSEGNFRMDKAALDVVAAIAVGNQLQAISASISALEKLADNDGALTLFDHHAAADLSGNFQVGAVQRGATGSLSMASGAFYFRTTARRGKFLFAQWGQNDVNFWAAAQKMTFNLSIYDKVRDAVQERLGQTASDFIAELKIS
jgi:hypothetical protein